MWQCSPWGPIYHLGLRKAKNNVEGGLTRGGANVEGGLTSRVIMKHKWIEEMSFHNPYSRTKVIHRNVEVLPKKMDLYRSRKSCSSPLIRWLGLYLQRWRPSVSIIVFLINPGWITKCCAAICFIRIKLDHICRTFSLRAHSYAFSVGLTDRQSSTSLAKTWSSKVKETTTVPQTHPPPENLLS